jgi:hypothetical protein
VGSQAGEIYLHNRGSFVSKITVRSLAYLIGISDKKDIKQYVFPQNTSLCSGSSCKILTRKTLFSKLEFYAENENDFNRYVPTWNFTIMINFKLQDIQCEEHFIPNWNFMPKKKEKKYFVETKLSDL